MLGIFRTKGLDFLKRAYLGEEYFIWFGGEGSLRGKFSNVQFCWEGIYALRFLVQNIFS